VRGDFPAVLDACVLIPMPLADTLLRLAAGPRLYLPKRTDEIMAEVSRNLIEKFDVPEATRTILAETPRREGEP
jgi:hypothetical protein